MNQIEIGKFLQQLRKEKGLTQEQLAEQFQIARRTVSRWETGSNLPDLDLLIELSDFYAVDLREILNGERTDKKMNKDMEETVLKVAEYSNAEKQRTAKVVTVFFIIGLLALAINTAMEVMGTADTFWAGYIKGVTLGISFGAMILGLLFVSGRMAKVMAFKKRLLSRQGVTGE